MKKNRQNADRRITDKGYQNILTEKKKEYKNNKTSYVHVCTARDTAAEALCMYGRNGNISFNNSRI